MSIVIDASVTLAWLFDDEVTPSIDELFDSIAITAAIVPALWSLEVANGLQVAIRRRRIEPAFRDRSLDRLKQLPIEIDTETDLHAWGATLRLSDKNGLTPYDAAYLELAQRRRARLATLDRLLKTAAGAEGVDALSLLQ